MKVKNQKTKILAYLQKTPWATAATIQRGIGMKGGNVYVVLNDMVRKSLIQKNDKSKTYSLPSKYKLEPTPKPQPPAFTPNPLIATLQEEIEFINSGIDSLMITKSYINRRIEQLRLEDIKRARVN